ncbi:hypothetical protein GCM10010335_68970 [Streptomyces galbus]|nr:hypothetical protein GCM10010335_68970 [Streptomyces galbus]
MSWIILRSRTASQEQPALRAGTVAADPDQYERQESTVTRVDGRTRRDALGES